MNLVLRILVTLLVTVILCATGGAAWLYFHTSDLPSIAQLASFTPVQPSDALLHECDGTVSTVHALSADHMGNTMLMALTAAEGRPDPRSPFHALLADMMADPPVNRGRYSLQIARTLTCANQSPLARSVQQLRLANAIERRFDSRQVLTIYLNRVYLGPDMYGVEAGANGFFGKRTTELSLSEAALLAGLIAAPGAYSPRAHPERAVQRRNLVLDEMVSQRSIERTSADRARAAPLSIRE